MRHNALHNEHCAWRSCDYAGRGRRRKILSRFDDLCDSNVYFYKLTMSIINMVKARKEKSLLLITLRNIGYSDALVSLLSLQTALFAAFGQAEDEFIPVMNALTGAAVCLMVLGLGIYMVHNAGEKKLAWLCQMHDAKSRWYEVAGT